jgi:hypothetical protein
MAQVFMGLAQVAPEIALYEWSMEESKPDHNFPLKIQI